MLKFKIIFISCMLSILLSASAQAQVIPPSNVDAGAIDEVNTKNLEHINLFNKNKNDIDLNIQKKESNEIPAVNKNKKFLLNQINFSGNTVFDEEKLDKYSEELIGQEVTLDQIKELTVKITNLYREKGYVTSLAYIPPQKIENGFIEIAIIEGKIGNIEIHGNKWVRTSYIRDKILKKNDLQDKKIFNVNSLKS